MQAERIKASMESIGKSRTSSEGSSEKPSFDSGERSSSKQSRRGKRKRGQRHNKKRHDDTPDSEVPFTIDEEDSRDVDEPPEKRSREEETGDSMILALSLSFSFLS